MPGFVYSGPGFSKKSPVFQETPHSWANQESGHPIWDGGYNAMLWGGGGTELAPFTINKLVTDIQPELRFMVVKTHIITKI